MNPVKVGFFSMSGGSPTGDDRPYLRWHQLDHMPEQYQIPGLVNGQRWASTPACRAARAAESDELAPVRYVVQYLMSEPVGPTLDEFVQLGRHLAEVGRYPERVTSHLLGAFDLVDAYAAPRVLVSAAVIPMRPHRGVYVIVERPTPDVLESTAESAAELLAVAGVAGVWSFRTSATWSNPAWTPEGHRVTVCYLDDDPVGVAEELRPVLERRWRDGLARPVLSAPFESLATWDWGRFENG